VSTNSPGTAPVVFTITKRLLQTHFPWTLLSDTHIPGWSRNRKNLSLVHEARHLCGDLSKSDHFPTLPYDEPTIVTPLRTDLGLAVDLAESAALLRSPSDLTPEAARSAGFPREVWSRCNDNGNVFVKALVR
jgi:hypothetical protein